MTANQTPEQILTRTAEILEERDTESPAPHDFWCALGAAVEGHEEEQYWPAVDLAWNRIDCAEPINTWIARASLAQVLAMLRGEDWRKT